MVKINTFFLLMCSFSLIAQSEDSNEIKRMKLRNTLTAHYQNDAQKQKAVVFLMDNIQIHFAENYYWVNEKNMIIPFDELQYNNFNEAITTFKKLKDSIQIKPQTYKLKDIDTVTPELLINNIDLAFESWRTNPWSKSYDFNTFCEYILPYRSMTEPLEEWRSDYQFLVSNARNTVVDKNASAEVATNVILELKHFRFLESRPDPIPFLSPKQLLFRNEGSCNDLANLAVLACRSLGLATSFDFTPFYGASSNKHFWNTIITETGKSIPFNGISSDTPEGLPYNYIPTHKRLAKVYRKTYSIQPTALATTTETLAIPEGFLKEKNLKDVTQEYVETGKINFSTPLPNPATTAYLNVYNLGGWRTIDFARQIENSFEFQNLGTSIVYLPSFYFAESKSMQYAAYPILLDAEKKQQVLKPNYTKTFSYDMTRDITKKGPTKDFNSFEVFDNEIFSLLVWDSGWKKIESATAQNKAIHFSKIPDNGLFLLLCKKSNGYERIFKINTDTREIEWY